MFFCCRYSDAVRLEQLKLYEQLVTHSRHQLLLVHESFLRPLLKILTSSLGVKFPTDVEKRLVILLNQLCVVLMQNVNLLDLFFCSTSLHQQESDETKWVFLVWVFLFSVLVLTTFDSLYFYSISISNFIKISSISDSNSAHFLKFQFHHIFIIAALRA